MAVYEFDEGVQTPPGARIKVIGVGGGGGNAINTMIAEGLKGVEFISVNTDRQALECNNAPTRLHIGSHLTRGLGAGANPDVGRNAALEDHQRIAELLDGADMVFVTAGMGGGTGTGAAPVIASIAREVGALTVGVVTKPFTFEGNRRRRSAEQGIQSLQSAVDTLITIPNQRLLAISGESTSLIDAFRRADEVLLHAVQGISDLITIGGYINVDFADVKTIMSNMGMALMGTGHGSGPNRAHEAAEMAISSPLLEDVSIHGATGILINITGGSDLTLLEINDAASLVQEQAHEEANIIFGAVIDETMHNEIKITVIATGFDRVRAEQHLTAQGYQQVPEPRYAAQPAAHPQNTYAHNPRPYEVQQAPSMSHYPAHQPHPAHHAQGHAPAFQHPAHNAGYAGQPGYGAQPAYAAPAGSPAQPSAAQPQAAPVQPQAAPPADWSRPQPRPALAQNVQTQPVEPGQQDAYQERLARSHYSGAYPAVQEGGAPHSLPQVSAHSLSQQDARRPAITRAPAGAQPPRPSGVQPTVEDELEIPTFLRNNKERNR